MSRTSSLIKTFGISDGDMTTNALLTSALDNPSPRSTIAGSIHNRNASSRSVTPISGGSDSGSELSATRNHPFRRIYVTILWAAKSHPAFGHRLINYLDRPNPAPVLGRITNMAISLPGEI
jgi:hypothetical protein